MADVPEPISQETPIDIPASDSAAPDGVTPAAPQEEFDSPQATLQKVTRPLGSIELLDDVDLDVRVELGRTEMYIEDVLRLGSGCVVELDKLAGDPVDVYVNQRLVAHGEVLVLGDNFCVRISDVVPAGGPREGQK
jgi:flagellar motor switch protein FliN/FliY